MVEANDVYGSPYSQGMGKSGFLRKEHRLWKGMIGLYLEDILKEFHREEGEAACNPEWREFFDALCQEAIKIGMELNNSCHTPEEIREIMGQGLSMYCRKRKN